MPIGLTAESSFFTLLMFVIWAYITMLGYDKDDCILLWIQFFVNIPLVLYMFTLAFFDGLTVGYGVMVSLIVSSVYFVLLGVNMSKK